MGLWRDLFSWGSGPPPAPERSTPMPSSSANFSRPLNFTLEIPEEMTYGAGSTMDGPLEPRIGRAQAMSVPSVKRSRDLICGTIGALPLRQYDSGRKQTADAFIDQPETDKARSVTMTQVVEDMLFEGRAWLRITAYNWQGYPAKAVRLLPRSVNVQQNQKVYYNTSTGSAQGATWEWVPDSELIRIDSPNDALLLAGARAIRRALMLDKTTDRYAKDPLPLGYFSPANENDPGDVDEIQEILDNWQSADKHRAWRYIGAALKANPLQWSPEQLGLASARQAADLDIARIAGLDPEDLGINTTSRTYQNAEMRRLDLIDFTLTAYVTAIEGRLSMDDVSPHGRYVAFDYAHFLRSDTLTRMQTYQLGREVGVYNDERIAKLENIPTATVPKPPVAAPAPDGAQQPEPGASAQQRPTREQVKASLPWETVTTPVPNSVRFEDSSEPMKLGFVMDPAEAEFKVDAAGRTISGVVVPFGSVARSNGRKWKFAKDSLHWGDNPSRVKLNKDHVRDESFGYGKKLVSTDAGLAASFGVARSALGNDMLSLAQDQVYDGFSIEVDFEPGDGWEPDPMDETVCLVYSATLRAVALTAMPAFDGARVAAVAAKREEIPMPKTAAELAAEAAAAEATAAANQPFDAAKFAADLGLEFAKIPALVAEAITALPGPQGRQIVPAGQGIAEVSEPLVYSMNGGSGPSMVKDAWKARTEGDMDARDRLTKFSLQLADAQTKASQVTSAQFAAGNTTNAAALIPPGYRPDLYVTQLLQGRPLWGSVSRGTLSDATPFTIPKFTSATGMAGTGTEGTNPAVGSLTVGTITVTPNSVTGLFTITREIADSSNPAIDAIATQAMSEAYSQNTEAKLYTLLNGAGGVGGVITAGQVPSGAWVYTSASAAGTTGGEVLLAKERQLLAEYPFHRFASPNHAHLSQEATTAYATAVDTTGRPLLPSVGAQNSVGIGNAMNQGWSVDGLTNVPTWSMTGNAAGDMDVLVLNSQDVWAWESPLLTFRFEERGGPANIDLALFGYVACQVLRPAGLHAIRHTVTPA